MFEGITTALQPVHIFVTTPTGYQWNWTALVVGFVQMSVIGYGIYVMHKASEKRAEQITQQDKRLEQQDKRLEQQAIDSERRHEQAMATLHALIERSGPRPPAPSAD